MPRFKKSVGFKTGLVGRQGQMGGSLAAGPGGVCVCTNPECQSEISHHAGIPCYQVKCPKCGSPMIRQKIGGKK